MSGARVHGLPGDVRAVTDHDGRVAGYFPFDVVDDPSLFGLERRTVPTSLGNLHLVQPRDGPTPKVLLLHGLGLDWTSWTPLLEAARREGGPHRGWVVVDLPGFGRSSPLPGPISLDDIGNVLVEALDHLGLDQVDLLGHSMGGFAALHLASGWPERVRSVACANGAYATIVDIVNAPVATAVRAPLTWVAYQSLALVAGGGSFTQSLVRGAAATGLLRLGLRGFAAHPFRVPHSLLEALATGGRPEAFRHAQATGRNYDCRSRWEAIQAPTLAVFGARDAVVTERDAAVLRRALPATTTRVLPDSAHLLPLEQPEVLLGVLDRWWSA